MQTRHGAGVRLVRGARFVPPMNRTGRSTMRMPVWNAGTFAGRPIVTTVPRDWTYSACWTDHPVAAEERDCMWAEYGQPASTLLQSRDPMRTAANASYGIRIFGRAVSRGVRGMPVYAIDNFKKHRIGAW